MKYFFPVIACLFIISCTHPKKKSKNELETLHYYGRVKIVTYKIHRAIDDSGKIKEGMILSKMITKCDSAGYFFEQGNYKGDKLVYQVVRHFDSKNNVTEEDKVEVAMQYISAGNTRPDSLSITRDSFALQYDEKGNKVGVKVTENGKPWYRDLNLFDDKGNIIEEKEYIPWDTLNKRETRKYDENGNLAEKAMFRPDRTMYAKYAYKYNDMGDITSLIAFQGDGSIATKEIMMYDDKGNKIVDSCNKNDGTVVYARRYQFTTYDDKGNWTKEITFASGKPISIIDRAIEYYK